LVGGLSDSLSLLDLFHAELETHSLTLEKGLAGGEASGSREQVEPLARAAHSLRGASRIVGLDRAARLAQAMEELLSAAQNGTRRLSQADLDHLRAANDFFRRLAACPASEIPGNLDAHSNDLEEIAHQLQSPPPEVTKPDLPQSSPAVPRVVTETGGPAASAGIPTVAVTGGPGTAGVAPAPQAVDPFLLDLFRTELETHSRVLEEGLVATEARQDPTKIQTLMRAAHSLKGASRIVGLDSAVRLAHAMEDMLTAAQRGERQLTGADFDLLLRGTDVFSGLAAREPTAIPTAVAESSGRIEELARQFTEPLRPAAASPASTPVSAAPAASAATSAPAAPPMAAVVPKAQAEKAEDASVRVSVQNLNRLTGFAGECLVEVKTLRPLTQTVQRIKQHHSVLSNAVEQALQAMGKESMAEVSAGLQEALEHAGWIHTAIPSYMTELERFSRKLEHLANRLYDEAVASRMRPFSDGLHGFSRMVRDLAKSLGKNVRFVIEGESTRVDRDILEKLEAPLTHLLRNAVDHGIEPPEARSRAGKPPEGRLTLSARHVAGVLEIVVAEDGGGIDPERIRRRIVERSYATPEMASKLSESEVLEFLFLPGFSTSQKVTEISGRGVGLDVVQSMARQVGGNVRIATKLGEGTRFVLQLPLTLSVVRTLMFEVKGQPYALPLTRIDRVLGVPPAEVLVVEDRQYIRVDNQSIGLVDAAQVLDWGSSERPAGNLHVLTLSDRLDRYGLVVDRFLGEHDLVVIPLPHRLGKVPNVSAGAILEDGSPVAILDSEDLVRSVDNLLTRGSLMKLGQKARAEKEGRKRVLVVDDSLTVREVERRLLENRGYEVTVAVDGMDGWNAVQGSRFDLVVTDVDMPRMDGIELVKRIKGITSTRSLPVMIVSYKDQEEYKTRGLEAGASYYLTKSSFHDETLIDAVRDLIGEPET
jgi:two-component system sensor histidine kinase and response regulator WspE